MKLKTKELVLINALEFARRAQLKTWQ